MNHARQNETCNQCSRKATLARRLDATGWRALYWCFDCWKAACGGDSFARVSREYLMSLPVVDESQRPSPAQRSLF